MQNALMQECKRLHSDNTDDQYLRRKKKFKKSIAPGLLYTLTFKNVSFGS